MPAKTKPKPKIKAAKPEAVRLEDTDPAAEAERAAGRAAALAGRTKHVNAAARAVARRLRESRDRRAAFWKSVVTELSDPGVCDLHPAAWLAAVGAACREGRRELRRIDRRAWAFADAIGVERRDLWSL